MKKFILTVAAACLLPFAATSVLAQGAPAMPADHGMSEPARVPTGGIKKHANKKPAAKKHAVAKAAKKPAKKAGKQTTKKHGKKP